MFHALPRGVLPTIPRAGEKSRQIELVFPPRNRPARRAAGTRCILVFRPVLQPRRGHAPERRMSTRLFSLPWPYMYVGLVSRWLLVSCHCRLRWFLVRRWDAERVLHLRRCKPAFGIIVERVWCLPDGGSVEESEGIPRWPVGVCSSSRGPSCDNYAQ